MLNTSASRVRGALKKGLIMCTVCRLSEVDAVLHVVYCSLCIMPLSVSIPNLSRTLYNFDGFWTHTTWSLHVAANLLVLWKGTTCPNCSDNKLTGSGLEQYERPHMSGTLVNAFYACRCNAACPDDGTHVQP